MDLLHELYTEVLIPPAVADEVERHISGQLDQGLATGWLKRSRPQDPAQVDRIKRELGGRGEAEVIALGLEIEDAILLIDEAAARRYARSLDLPVRGTIGILLHAKRRGSISHVSPFLDELRRSGFWLDEETYRMARELADEP